MVNSNSAWVAANDETHMSFEQTNWAHFAQVHFPGLEYLNDDFEPQIGWEQLA